MENFTIYVHGKGGSAEDAGHYQALFPQDEVIGFDYRSQTPWEAREEFPAFFCREEKSVPAPYPGCKQPRRLFCVMLVG